MASNSSAQKIISVTTVEDCKIIEIPKIKDPRGNIAVIEKDVIPFETKRVYYLYDVPSDASRGGHAHIHLCQFLIALSGSFDVILNDGEKQKKVTLNKPNKGLLIKSGIWRELENFSSGSVCLVLASNVFNEEDYIRSFDAFKLFKSR
ncbi:sugar 3,4-ketoisomerase [Aquimarina sp. 2201CG14-23]|uniref:sugar 3,4-ketoisomerase n=1 Tax=Aquimarina mycalae TaxID=3040073 RepID=UPI00247827A0|nr:FdtA/QdtA family cupin domain-containing protein [Aquimarina sp. 2201CG14-23]MDH7444982.1 FdtA/QdtA family cupin domain-containing protein [Aquimarina sp. 2201CG14-23]